MSTYEVKRPEGPERGICVHLRAETSRSTQFQLTQFYGRKHLSSGDGADSEAAEGLVECDQRR